MSHRWSRRIAVALLTAGVALVPCARAIARPGDRRIAVGSSPQVTALDRATETLYVSTGEGVAVVGVGARAPAATVAMSTGPLGVAVNQRTQTVYVAEPDQGTVAVIDGAACNARRTAGCANPPAQIQVGGVPFGVAINEVTNTVYADLVDRDAVAVIDGASCNRAVVSGCVRSPAHVAAGSGPGFPAVDEATNTVYVPDGGADGVPGSTMSVIDGRACSALTTTGCGETPASVRVGLGPAETIVDGATHTVYVSDFVDGTVALVDAAACNGRVHAGYGGAPRLTAAGNGANGLTIDARTHTLYVENTNADTLAAIDTARCSARDTSGCGRTWPTLWAGQQPTSVFFDARTRSLFITDQLDNQMLVSDARDCNARRTSGCRHEVPSVATGGARDLAVDPASHTLYVTQPGSDSLALVDTLACNATFRFGCLARPATVPLAGGPVGIVLDRSTQTLYVSDRAAGTVSVPAPRRCNVTSLGGCAPVAPPIAVGAGNAELTVDETTHTVYVANGSDDTVSIIDARECTAAVQRGCAQTPATVAAGPGPRRVTVDPATKTLYVSDFNGGDGHTVSVIDASACNAA